jgi:hypothetical protein
LSTFGRRAFGFFLIVALTACENVYDLVAQGGQKIGDNWLILRRHVIELFIFDQDIALVFQGPKIRTGLQRKCARRAAFGDVRPHDFAEFKRRKAGIFQENGQRADGSVVPIMMMTLENQDLKPQLHSI